MKKEWLFFVGSLVYIFIIYCTLSRILAHVEWVSAWYRKRFRYHGCMATLCVILCVPVCTHDMCIVVRKRSLLLVQTTPPLPTPSVDVPRPPPRLLRLLVTFWIQATFAPHVGQFNATSRQPDHFITIDGVHNVRFDRLAAKERWVVNGMDS